MARRPLIKPFDPLKSIYTPQETATFGVQAVEEIQSGAPRAMNWPIAVMGDYFAPMQAGQTLALQAQTSQYKSGTMRFLENAWARQLKDQGREDEVLIHVSLEELVEELAFHEFARLTNQDAGLIARGKVRDWGELLTASLTVAGTPVYRIGESLRYPDMMMELYLTNIARAIKALMDGEITGQKIRIAGIFVDYLQALPIDPEVRKINMQEQRRLQVEQDTSRLRSMSKWAGCPVVVGVQAKQNLTSKSSWQMPGLYDGAESASIAYRNDRVISIWLPKMTSTIGDTIDGPISFTVEENQCFYKVWKQRGGLPQGKTFPCRIDYASGNITYDSTLGAKARPESNQRVYGRDND